MAHRKKMSNKNDEKEKPDEFYDCNNGVFAHNQKMLLELINYFTP
jgi:hypothetical protein